MSQETLPDMTETTPLNEHNYAVIMAGGSGTRLWPMSRKNKPKQFLSLLNSQTMLQLMYQELRRVFTPSHIIIQTHRKFITTVQEQIPELPFENILVEPAARDTAPAFGFAAAYLLQRDPHAIMGIFYSDHIIKKNHEFVAAVETAYRSAVDFPNHITMIGVKPTSPHTGFGYIQIKNEAKSYQPGGEVFYVERFVEKPDLATAEQFVKSWEYFWNTGYKVCEASHLFSIIETLDKEMAEKLRKIAKLLADPKNEKEVTEIFEELPKISFEYLATEKVHNLLVVPSDMGWADIGDWKALHDMLMEVNGHHMITKGHHMGIDSENCLIFGGNKLVATLGLKDTIFIETEDVILVANKNKAQDIKKLITYLEEQNKHLYL